MKVKTTESILKYPSSEALKKHILNSHLNKLEFTTYYLGEKTNKNFWADFCIQYKNYIDKT